MSVLPSVLIRFCGLTPHSKSLRHLLESLCHQLREILPKQTRIPKDFANIQIWFREFLTQGDCPGIVVLFISGLDQLDTSDFAHFINWLPSKLARNIKIILSTATNNNSEILANLQSKITNERYHLQLSDLNQSECAELLSSALSGQGRIVNFLQWRRVRDMFQIRSSPFYVKLLFEEAYKWKSYSTIDENILSLTVEATIEKLFADVEVKHGRLLTSRTLGYLTATQSGVSEAELDDVMTLDDDVMCDVYATYEAPVCRY